MQALGKSEVNGWIVEIYPDQDATSPRDDDSPGCGLVMSARGWDFPNDAGVDLDLFSSWQEVARHLAATVGALVTVPVYMIDHSGIAFRAGNDFGDCDPGGWDSGQVGVAYVTPQIWADTQGTPWTGSDADAEQARRLIAGDVEIYGQYVNGETCGYTITDPVDGEQVDACWGIYGYSDAEQEAKAAAEALTHEPKCTGALNHRTGQIEHAGACPIHNGNGHDTFSS